MASKSVAGTITTPATVSAIDVSEQQPQTVELAPARSCGTGKKNPVPLRKSITCTKMETIATPKDFGAERRLPICRSLLVSWASRQNGLYLVRNRSTGETFQLGEEEQFILERLDERSSADQICAAYAARFGQTLALDELSDFFSLAAQQGLLEPDGLGVRPFSCAFPRAESFSVGLPRANSKAPSIHRQNTPKPGGVGNRMSPGRPLLKRTANRLLAMTAALLR